MTTPQLKRPVPAKFKLVGIGEILWDLLPGGRQMGGAPANFAYHAGALGAEAHVISRVGADALGRELIQRLQQLGVPSDGLEVGAAAATGTVTVELAAGGQPQFHIHENVAWDALSGQGAGREAVAGADAVCFGSLAQRSETSRATIRSLVAAAPAAALRIFDVNLRQHYFTDRLLEESLRLANVLKVSDGELNHLADRFGLGGEAPAQMAELASRYGLRLVACTRGERGSLLYAGGQWSEHPGQATQVVDTVGAGDSFTAAMTLGWLAGWELDRVNEEANRVAAYVCSCAGATPALPVAMRATFESARRTP